MERKAKNLITNWISVQCFVSLCCYSIGLCRKFSEYAKFTGPAGHVRRILKMSGKGVWSRWTFCPARAFQGQYLTNRCPAISLIFAGHFTAKCPARIQNVQRRTWGSSDKMSSEAQMNFAYSDTASTKFQRPKKWEQTILYIVVCHSPMGSKEVIAALDKWMPKRSSWHYSCSTDYIHVLAWVLKHMTKH